MRIPALRFASLFTVCCLTGVLPLAAQKPTKLSTQPPAALQQAKPPKAPALVNAAGPAVSLETSEALFDVATALNACGYNEGLEKSDPVRKQVRAAVEQVMVGSAPARFARDQVCTFVNQHRLFEGSRDLAQYISLALYLTPPPDLALSVDAQDLPPDATQVMGMLPILHAFAQATDLHAIWIQFRPEYDAEIDALHDPLTQMILNTNIYLKLPTSTYSGSRFIVVLSPMVDPGQTNARVYGSNYVVVASPVGGHVNMKDVRHTYLHYEIEPLLYQHSGAMDRLLPLLKVIRDAPLGYEYRDNIASLVIECLIRAIEAQTLDTGVPIFKIPADAARADIPRLQHKHDETLQQSNAVREKVVEDDMRDGFVLTQYFYNQLSSFERNPESLTEAIGPMVYGMDVDQQIHNAKHIEFFAQAPADVVHSAAAGSGLDRAESEIRSGDAEAAGKLALEAIHDHTADPARANYVLGLTWLMKGDPQSAANDFNATLQLTKDPRLLAWSHIWLGRIDDVKDDRPEALSEYKTAMTDRDGQPDTLQAIQQGLDKPYTVHAATGADQTPTSAGDPR
jgi:tetratricopeptide (TPR) repeat protein